MHYAKTLEHWLARFDASFDAVVREFSTDFARMWRLYLAGSVASFRAGNLQLFQVLFAGSRCQSVPLTREHLYVTDQLETCSELWTRAM
jgi:cyclopropane-fatty-acyl-phospholipid synthase